MCLQLLYSERVIASEAGIVVGIDFSLIPGLAWGRPWINIMLVDGGITQGRGSLEPKTTPTEHRGSENSTPAHPLTGPGQERCVGLAPEPPVPRPLRVCLARQAVSGLQRSPSPSWEFFAVTHTMGVHKHLRGQTSAELARRFQTRAHTLRLTLLEGPSRLKSGRVGHGLPVQAVTHNHSQA